MQDRKHIVPLLKWFHRWTVTVWVRVSLVMLHVGILSTLSYSFISCAARHKSPSPKWILMSVVCLSGTLWQGRPMTVQHDVYMSVSTSKADRNGDTGEGKHSMHKLALKNALMCASILALNVEWKCNIAGLYFSWLQCDGCLLDCGLHSFLHHWGERY